MGVRPGTNWTSDDLDYIGRPREERYDSWGTAEVLNEHRDRIAVGQSMDGISELGHLHRQLLQESDFHAAGRTLLKKLDPDEENERFGFDGKHLPDELKVVLLALDEFGIGSATLKSTIRLAGDDEETIDWITKHWETFLEVDPEDALANAEFNLGDVEDTGHYEVRDKNKLDIGVGPQRDSYRVVEVFRKSYFKEAAERRLVHLKNTLRSIQVCEHPEEVEIQLGSIRGAYEEDRVIIEAWGPKRREEDRKLYLQLLHARRERIEKLNEEGRDIEPMDFERIRRKMWFCFDREREEIIIEDVTRPVRKEWMQYFDVKTGAIVEEGYLTEQEIQEIIQRGDPDPRKYVAERVVTPPALWEIEKSRAFCELNQTRKQWNRAYDYLWEKMCTTILWRLRHMRSAEEGIKLADYIRRFQFRLDSEKLGEIILEKAAKAKTERGKDLIRLLLASCQYQLDKEMVQKIVKEIVKRKI